MQNSTLLAVPNGYENGPPSLEAREANRGPTSNGPFFFLMAAAYIVLAWNFMMALPR